jgi:hypothetical protein
MCAPCERVRRGSEAATLVRIIHECRRENTRKRVPCEAYLVVRWDDADTVIASCASRARAADRTT